MPPLGQVEQTCSTHVQSMRHKSQQMLGRFGLTVVSSGPHARTKQNASWPSPCDQCCAAQRRTVNVVGSFRLGSNRQVLLAGFLNIGSTYWFHQLHCAGPIPATGLLVSHWASMAKNAIVVPPHRSCSKVDGSAKWVDSTIHLPPLWKDKRLRFRLELAVQSIRHTPLPQLAIDHRFGLPMRLHQRRAAQLGARARPIEDCFVIERTTPMRNTLRNTRGELCEIRFLPLEDAERPDLILETLIQPLLDRVLEGYSPPMLVGLQLHPPGFDRPYVIRLRPPEQNNAAALAAAIERLNEQSAAGIDLLAGTTVTKVLAVWPLESIRADAQRGGGCDFDAEHHVSNTVQSLVRVVNPNDRHCLARAVLLGLRDRETRQPNGGGRDAFAAYAARQNHHGPEAVALLTRAGIAVGQGLVHVGGRRSSAAFDQQTSKVSAKLGSSCSRRSRSIGLFSKETAWQRVSICAFCWNVGTSTMWVASSKYSKCLTTVLTVSDEKMRVTTQLDAKLYVASAFDSVPDSRVNRNSCQMVGAVLIDVTNVASFFRTMTATITILPTWLQRQLMVVANVNDNQFVSGVVFAVHVAASHMQTIIAVLHSIALPDQLIVVVVMGGTRWMSPVSSNRSLTDQLVTTTTTTTTTTTMMMTMTTMILSSMMMKRMTNSHSSLLLRRRNHVPLLIVAEIICEPCIRAGISVNDGFGRRAPDCVCLCRMVRGQQMRRWSSPPFVNEAGDNTLPPDGAPTFNQRRFYFHSFDNEANDPIEQFLLFLMKHGPRSPTLSASHTMVESTISISYLRHFIVAAFHQSSCCTTGLKIYSMKLRGMNQRRITFKDSINYFFCELDALVKSFDLPQHLATVKPFFPYLYIQRQHLRHRLNGLPAIEHYSPDTMKVEKRTKFLRWHGDNNADGNFQLTGTAKILIGEHTQGLDPFLCASTAAGLALATLRRCFLPANRLVHSPEGGYLRGRRASAESRRYIRFFELENQGAQVQCADWSVGEAHIEDSGYRVDGLWRREPPLRPFSHRMDGMFLSRYFPINKYLIFKKNFVEDVLSASLIDNKSWQPDEQPKTCTSVRCGASLNWNTTWM
ncbi:hypothetical protein niasHT_035481 [Heterodera trifolii]|uniref:Uncharacterized protein n=1 Tax=Heterodera trifolii TaxID=157864 RepID=A0ABD2IER5_9BILA